MKTLILLVTLSLSPWVLADQNDPRLPDLFSQLTMAISEQDATQFEIRIWDIWAEHADPTINNMMFHAMDEMGGNQLAMALQSFSTIIELDPEFAEAWNMRATTHFLLGNYRQSLSDILKTLELEPHHFGALSGLGMVYVELGQYLDAQNALTQALQIHPFLDGAQSNLDALDRFFNDTAI
jgi:tetratricopeptide (TPR) repeat protein